jgi:group I intron endonuclease
MDKGVDQNIWNVYMHINRINGKKYIGITSQNPKNRWKACGKGYRNNKHFWRAIQKYGWDNFKHEILLTNETFKYACAVEKILIKVYNTTNPQYGYNNTMGGQGTLGLVVSKETREKISKTKRDNYIKENHPNFNKHIPEKSKKKMSEAKRGKYDGKNNPNARQIVQLDLNGNFIRCWDYMKQASEILSINKSCIRDCCAERQQTAGGYKWMYSEQYFKKVEITD